MGLTGIVVEATLRLLPIETSRCLVDTERIETSMRSSNGWRRRDTLHRYSVVWIDLVATGIHLGRSVLTQGDHATSTSCWPPSHRR